MDTFDHARSVGRDSVVVSIGDHATNVAAGINVSQTAGVTGGTAVTSADLAALHELFAELKRQVEVEAPPEKQLSALERIQEMEDAVSAKKPDLTTVEYVRNWFAKHLPLIAGSVTSVLINPIVGKVVEAAGELAAEQFRRMLDQG